MPAGSRSRRAAFPDEPVWTFRVQLQRPHQPTSHACDKLAQKSFRIQNLKIQLSLSFWQGGGLLKNRYCQKDPWTQGVVCMLCVKIRQGMLTFSQQSQKTLAYLIFVTFFTLPHLPKFATNIAPRQNSANHHSRAKLCAKLQTVCKITHCVQNNTPCAKLHTMCKITHHV